MKGLNNTPDIASTRSSYNSPLNRVGMEKVESILNIDGRMVPGQLSLYVNLADPSAKGIHMSRLFLSATEGLEKNSLSGSSIQNILAEFLESHSSLSTDAKMMISWTHSIKRPALLSQYSGWRQYPIKIFSELKSTGEYTLVCELSLTYSSTCPCSAALARSLIQDKFKADFENKESFSKDEMVEWLSSEKSILATPHGQRSHACIKVSLNQTDSFSEKLVESLIEELEQAIATPVQTAVKRQDEQEFARLNGQNLMFAEDAARHLHSALLKNSQLSAFSVSVSHEESLHPHNAVAYSSNGELPGFSN